MPALGIQKEVISSQGISRHYGTPLTLPTGNHNDEPPIHQRSDPCIHKAMHGTRKVGNYWSHIPDCAPRVECTLCHSTDSMDHMVYCQAAPRRSIWHLAKNLWPHEHIPWPDIDLGIILGCGSISPPVENPQADPNVNNDERTHPTHPRSKRGAKRLLQILLSEAAHLIWVLRCERVILDPDDPPRFHTEEEINARWLRAINTRLTDDRIIATKIRRDERTLRLVRETWKLISQQSLANPDDWLYNREVLVGRVRNALP